MEKIVNGVVVEMSSEETAELKNEWQANLDAQVQNLEQNGYKYNRAKAYLNFGDQLDFLWHSMGAGEFPMCKDFYDSRLAVKQKYPKPAS